MKTGAIPAPGLDQRKEPFPYSGRGGLMRNSIENTMFITLKFSLIFDQKLNSETIVFQRRAARHLVIVLILPNITLSVQMCAQFVL